MTPQRCEPCAGRGWVSHGTYWSTQVGAYEAAKQCEVCKGSGLVYERAATPDEVDAGCELGITWDPAPASTP